MKTFEVRSERVGSTNIRTIAEMDAIVDSMSTAEKIETIVNAFIKSGCKSGRMGSLVTDENGSYLVHADGKTFRVTGCAQGWKVRSGLMVAINSSMFAAVNDLLAVM
jgi:hypothetical protein